MINEQQLRMKIKDLRIKSGLTEAEVAQKLGKSGNSYVNRIENGPTKINIEILEELCSFYKISPLELFQTQQAASSPQQQKGFFEKSVFRAETSLDENAKEEIKSVLPTLRKIGKIQKVLNREPVKLDDIAPELKNINLHSPFAAQATAREAAFAVRKFFKYDQNSSVDVASLCWNNLNIPICGLDLGTNCWGLYSSDKVGNPLIVYSNVHQFLQRNNFTIAHEVGHYLFTHDLLNIDCESSENNIIEKIANTFAQELLVPAVALREVYDDLGLSLVKDLKPHHIVLLANHFKVSFFMMIVVLRQTQKINSTTYSDLKEYCTTKLEQDSASLGYEPSKYFNHIKPLKNQLRELVLIALRKELISFFDASQLLDEPTAELKAAL